MLDIAELRLQTGSVLAIIGPNGSGKTTLLKTLAALQEPATGVLRFQGRPLDSRAARQAYRQRCAVCHGPLGDGKGSLTEAYGARPANLQGQAILDYPDGKIHWVILHGKNAMPGHQADLDEDQPWALVHYLRALQRAQHARKEDLP